MDHASRRLHRCDDHGFYVPPHTSVTSYPICVARFDIHDVIHPTHDHITSLTARVIGERNFISANVYGCRDSAAEVNPEMAHGNEGGHRRHPLFSHSLSLTL